MIKRSPKEIADFFQMYVFQASMYSSSCFRCSDEKPELSINGEHWEMKSWIDLPDELISIPADHDWTHLYEPRPNGLVEVFKSIQARNHSSEVYIGDRYVLLGEFQPNELMKKVEEHFNDGFKLYGNPFTGPDTSCGYIHYQAMVRQWW